MSASYLHGVGYHAVITGNHGKRMSRYGEGDVVCVDDAPQFRRIRPLTGYWRVMAIEALDGSGPCGFAYTLCRVNGRETDWGCQAGPFLDFSSPTSPEDRDDTFGWQLIDDHAALAGVTGRPQLTAG